MTGWFLFFTQHSEYLFGTMNYILRHTFGIGQWQMRIYNVQAMTITIYSTPSCTYCKQAKEFLTSHGVSYQDIDVSVDAARRDEMVDKSGQLGVPVFDIDGQVVVGYNEQLISKMVGIGAPAASVAIEESPSELQNN